MVCWFLSDLQNPLHQFFCYSWQDKILNIDEISCKLNQVCLLHAPLILTWGFLISSWHESCSVSMRLAMTSYRKEDVQSHVYHMNIDGPPIARAG